MNNKYLIYKNKYIDNTNKDNTNKDNTNKDNTNKDNTNKEEDINIEDINYEENNIILLGGKADIWWLNYYLSVPICSYGRFTQASGTCWCNAALNIFYLTIPLQNLLITEFNKLPNKNDYINKYKSYESYNVKAYNTLIDNYLNVKNNKEAMNIYIDNELKIMIYNVVNLLLIQKIKPNYDYITLANDDQKTFTNLFALLLQMARNTAASKFDEGNLYAVDKNTNTRYVDKTEAVEDGGLSDEALIRLLNITFPNKILLLQEDAMFKIFSKGLSRFYPTHEESNILITLRNFYSNKTFTETLNINDEYIIKMFKNLKDIPLFLITGFKYNNRIIPSNININSNNYKLCAACVSVNSEHAVSGLVCNDNYYIYDSNNNIVYTEWNKFKYNNYSKIYFKRYQSYEYNARNNFEDYNSKSYDQRIQLYILNK